MDFVYGEVEHNLIFMPRDEALKLASVHRALRSAKTWGEFRSLLPKDVWLDLEQRLREYCKFGSFEQFSVELLGEEPDLSLAEAWERYLRLDWGDERPPAESDLFGFELVPGTVEGDWPAWPAQEMLYWVPRGIREKHGERQSSVHNGPFLRLDPEKETEIVAAFRDAGHHLEKHEALVRTASGCASQKDWKQVLLLIKAPERCPEGTRGQPRRRDDKPYMKSRVVGGAAGVERVREESAKKETKVEKAQEAARQVREITLPDDAIRLEEANFPTGLAAALAGKAVTVEILPEEAPGTKRAEPDENPVWIDREGNRWNDYRPTRVLYTDAQGRVWRLPRHWVTDALLSNAPQLDSHYPVTRDHVFPENLHLPSRWDLLEINVPSKQAEEFSGKPVKIEVRLSPDAPVQVFWQDGAGGRWRIPHTWRRRRVRLPTSEVLVTGGVSPAVAASYAGRVVSVNYHPGSLCCMPEHYRFRDEKGNRWPIKIQDCFVLGYGDVEEHPA
jgi:hypothetical protein